MKFNLNKKTKWMLSLICICSFSISCTSVKNIAAKPDVTNIPVLNKQVIEYVNSVIGKKIDRGECWDLANQALTRIGADWDRQFKFGKPVDPKTETIYPGDMIHFKNVRTKWVVGNTTYTGSADEHTAIVYQVISAGVYKVAEQNTSYSGKTVGIGDFDLSHVVKGKVDFYRPVKK